MEVLAVWHTADHLYRVEVCHVGDGRQRLRVYLGGGLVARVESVRMLARYLREQRVDLADLVED